MLDLGAYNLEVMLLSSIGEDYLSIELRNDCLDIFLGIFGNDMEAHTAR